MVMISKLYCKMEKVNLCEKRIHMQYFLLYAFNVPGSNISNISCLWSGELGDWEIRVRGAFSL